jgi:1,4-dihydroxy-2-naphthoyl-CoA hydrolase
VLLIRRVRLDPEQVSADPAPGAAAPCTPISAPCRSRSWSSLTPAGTTYLIFCYDYVMQDSADTQPGPDADVDLSAEAASRFAAAAGLVVDSAGGTCVVGHIDLGPDHHTPWGVVHGGVYTTAVETAASLGASLAVRDRGQFAVGVHNATDFLRPASSGRAEVIAEPLQQGRVQQLWLVTITDERGRALARGQLRLQNVPLPGTGTN